MLRHIGGATLIAGNVTGIDEMDMSETPGPAWGVVSGHAISGRERAVRRLHPALWIVGHDRRVGATGGGADGARGKDLDGVAGERRDPGAGHVPTLDLKEPQGTLPLSDELVKCGCPLPPGHPASSILSVASPDRSMASAVKAESVFTPCVCDRARCMVGHAA